MTRALMALGTAGALVWLALWSQVPGVASARGTAPRPVSPVAPVQTVSCARIDAAVLSYSPTGALSGCVQVGPLASGPYVMSFQTELLGRELTLKKSGVPGADRSKQPAVTLSLSPDSGPPGTVVKVTVKLDGRGISAGSGAGADFCWDGCLEGLRLGSGRVRWISGSAFTAHVTVPSAPWIEAVAGGRVLGYTSGSFPIGVQCVTGSNGCQLASPDGDVAFHLLVSRPYSWCRSADSCGQLTVAPSHAPAGAFVRVSGHVPLGQYDTNEDVLVGQIQTRPGRARGPAVHFAAETDGETTVTAGLGALDVVSSSSFADLRQTAPVTEVTDGHSLIMADPSDSSIVAWCSSDSIGMSVNGVQSTISTAAVLPFLRGAGFDVALDGSVADCVDVDPLSGTTVAAAFNVGLKPYGAPPVYEVGLQTSDGGKSWTLLPVPPGTHSSGFANFRGAEALFAGSVEGFDATAMPTYNPDLPLLEQTSDAGQSWRTGRLSCPANGPCVTFGPYVTGNCAMGLSSQDVLRSTNGGLTWRQAPIVGGQLVPCGEAELYATRNGTELLVNTLSSYLLQRSTDGGATWHYVSVPLPAHDQFPGQGLGVGPGGITVLPSGALLLSGEQAYADGWQLLRPGATSWCAVAGVTKGLQSAQQESALTVIGHDLWWLTATGTGDHVHKFPVGQVVC